MSKSVRRKPPLSDPGPPLSPLHPKYITPTLAWRIALAAILALYVALAVLHAGLAPLGQTGYQNAPDEAAHVTYVRSLATGHLPTRASAKHDPVGYEWHQPPLYYAIAAPFLRFGDRALRGVSIVLGVVAILLIYAAGRRLFPDDPALAVVAAGLAALTPTHIAITSTVNNDVLLEVLCSASMLLMIETLRSGPSLLRSLLMGLFIGLAILTKATGLMLIPAALAALLLLLRQGESPRRIAVEAFRVLAAAFVVCSWWLVWNMSRYGQPIPLGAFRESFGGTALASNMARELGSWGAYYSLVAQWTFQSFYGVYGTAHGAAIGKPEFLPPQFYLIVGIFWVVAIVGLGRAYSARNRDFTEYQRLAFPVMVLWIVIVNLSFLAFVAVYFQTQGRYIFPAMLPIALLGATGWRFAVPDRYVSMARGILLGVFAALSCGYINFVAQQGR